MNLYLPWSQHPRTVVTFLARTLDGQPLPRQIQSVAAAVNPNLVVFDAQSLESLQNGAVETQLRIAAIVAGTVGLVGLLLAAIGVYGVTAYAVTQRTREIGIRLTLGADRTTVIRMVLRQGMMLVAIGSAFGLLIGAGAGVLLSAQLGAPPPDALMFAGSALLFAFVGFVACYLPARRATQIGAMEALRYEVGVSLLGLSDTEIAILRGGKEAS
jgi:putative ABC transport system permease protein